MLSCRHVISYGLVVSTKSLMKMIWDMDTHAFSSADVWNMEVGTLLKIGF